MIPGWPAERRSTAGPSWLRGGFGAAQPHLPHLPAGPAGAGASCWHRCWRLCRSPRWQQNKRVVQVEGRAGAAFGRLRGGAAATAAPCRTRRTATGTERGRWRWCGWLLWCGVSGTRDGVVIDIWAAEKGTDHPTGHGPPPRVPRGEAPAEQGRIAPPAVPPAPAWRVAGRVSDHRERGCFLALRCCARPRLLPSGSHRGVSPVGASGALKTIPPPGFRRGN